MVSAIKTQIIKIGNSQGIRIPKVLIEQCGLHSEIELEVQEDCLVVRPASRSREGWEEACIEMAKNRDDSLLDGEIATTWGNAEWEW